MKVGVIGAGVMDENHIRNYCHISGVELVGIADINKERVEALSRQYSTEGFQNYHELLKRDLDAVSVVVPTTLHKKVALDAIGSGANLLVEKPIADTLENAELIARAAEKEKLKDWIKEAKVEKKEPLRNELESFLEACKNDGVPLTTGEDGIHALRVAIASIESYKSRSAINVMPYRHAAPETSPALTAIV